MWWDAFRARGLIELPGFFRQHDRDAVADRISELCGARDQLLLLGVIFQRTLGERAHQDLQELGIDGTGGTIGWHRGHDLVHDCISIRLLSRVPSRYSSRMASCDMADMPHLTAALGRLRSGVWRAQSR